MKKIFSISVISILLSLNMNIFGQGGWNLIHTFDEEISSVIFRDPLNGFAAGTKIYKTTDGGQTWNDIAIQGINGRIWEIKYVNNSFYIGVGDSGTIIKSFDSGETWTVDNIGEHENLKSICSIGDSILFACNWSNKIYKSSNYGNTWSVTEVHAYILYDIAFSNSQTGFGVGLYNTSVKTTDGGETWFAIPPIIPERSMFAVKFSSEYVGYVVGGSQIARTTDSGSTWTLIYDPFEGHQLMDITTFGNNTAWVVGSDKIIKTTDAGNTWRQQSFSPFYNLSSAFCVDSLICFAVGSEGALYKTTNGGVTGADESFPVLNSFKLLQNYPNPFNPTTTINYNIPQTEFVTLKIYDLLGREVATLINEEKPAGSYEVEFDGSGLTSGVYFYKLEAGNYISVKKLLLLK